VKRSKVTLLVLAAISLVLLAIAYGPIVVTVITAFVPIRLGELQWDHPSLDSFRVLFQDGDLLQSLLITLIVGVIASATSIAISTGAAIYSTWGTGPGRKALEFLIFLPFIMPPMITGLALLIFFREVGVDRSLITVVIGHVVLLLAVAYRTIGTRLRELSRTIIEASYDLGGSTWNTFLYVILPLLMPSVFAAFVLCFALSFDETLVTVLLTGGQSTFPIRLWGMMRMGFTPSVSAVVVLVLGASAFLSLAAIRILMPASRRPA
jgi:ABC-type spermidine/putrescine transport system permease subunit II